MCTRAMLFMRGGATTILKTTTQTKTSSIWRMGGEAPKRRLSSVKACLEPPDVARLAQTARISLTQQEVEEFGPKIQQVVGWFGQLQAIDLESIEPAVRADTDTGFVREDVPEEFENREDIISGIPKYDEPYIKVPKVLNKE